MCNGLRQESQSLFKKIFCNCKTHFGVFYFIFQKLKMAILTPATNQCISKSKLGLQLYLTSEPISRASGNNYLCFTHYYHIIQSKPANYKTRESIRRYGKSSNSEKKTKWKEWEQETQKKGTRIKSKSRIQCQNAETIRTSVGKWNSCKKKEELSRNVNIGQGNQKNSEFY